ncbi:20482_t:CDS:2, partial [Dentiscutata erythropus]
WWVLVLFKTLGEKLNSNKDNIISLVEATKKAASKEERTPFQENFKIRDVWNLAKVLAEDFRRRLFGRQLFGRQPKICSYIIMAIIFIWILLLYNPLLIGFIFVYIIGKFLSNEQADKFLSNEKASHKRKILKSSLEENIGITFDTSTPVIIKKYIIYTAILWLKMKTKYQFKIESMVITEKQRNELRRLLCGIVNEEY